MVVTQYGVKSFGSLSIPNRMEDMLKSENQNAKIEIHMLLTYDEFKKFLEFKKTFDN